MFYANLLEFDFLSGRNDAIAKKHLQDEIQRIAREKEEELEKRRQQVAEFERQQREALEKIEEKLRNEMRAKV